MFGYGYSADSCGLGATLSPIAVELVDHRLDVIGIVLG